MGIYSILAKGARYTARAAKLAPEFLVGTGAEAVGRGMRATKGSLWTKVKGGAKALEKDIAKKSVKGGYFKRTFKELVSTPKAIIKSGKAGARAARIAGKSTVKGAVKGGFKAVAKRMPVIGAVLTVALEGPNIVKAFKEGGFKAGMKEVGGAGIELGAMAAGAAIGSAICPGIGTIIGGIIGGIGGALIRGKTYSDKAEEKEEYTKQLQEYGFSKNEIKQLQENGYTLEDVEAALAEEAKAQKQAQAQEQVQAQPRPQAVKPIAQENQETIIPNKNEAVQDNTVVDTQYPRTNIQSQLEYLEEQNRKLQEEIDALKQSQKPVDNNTAQNPFQNPVQGINTAFQYINPYMINPFMGMNNMNMVNPYMQLFGGFQNPFLANNQFNYLG